MRCKHKESSVLKSIVQFRPLKPSEARYEERGRGEKKTKIA
jgi:hypothetical protein